ncbi:MAG: asparaginase, partial [Spirochaetota bacterium]
MSGDAIRVIVTGGTFDKHYDEIRGELTFRDSHVPEILRRARV